MDIARLERDIVDQMVELQIKLGYASESTRLYYKPESLAALVGVAETDDAHALVAQLQGARTLADGPLGAVTFGTHEDRVEVRIPPQGARYVHEQVPEPPFLRALIDLFATRHHPAKDEVTALFAEHSPTYVVDDMPEGAEFDYAVHFGDDTVDAHYYCFKEEMGHLIYHRFTEADYLRLLED